MMIRRKPLRSLLFLSGTLTLSISLVWAAEGIISKVPDATGKFCHLRFPAVRKNTLSSNRPILKDPSEGDIIDFYGPCDYDPLGKEEIRRQRADAQREHNRMDGDE